LYCVCQIWYCSLKPRWLVVLPSSKRLVFSVVLPVCTHYILVLILVWHTLRKLRQAYIWYAWQWQYTNNVECLMVFFVIISAFVFQVEFGSQLPQPFPVRQGLPNPLVCWMISVRNLVSSRYATDANCSTQHLGVFKYHLYDVLIAVMLGTKLRISR